jgi:malonyl-ACP O-methyltransferase BioC
MDKQILAKNFSRYAYLYDRYANVQLQAAHILLSRIPEINISHILELGCGTGIYTNLLNERFPQARIKAIDISKGMLEVARYKLKQKSIRFLVADAEEISFREEFDLITANACFQWFTDLTQALAKYKGLLKPGGAIAFSVFGPKTFFELNSVVGIIKPGTAISAGAFLEKKDIRKALLRDFKEAEVREITYEENFSSLVELFKKIKYTGTRGDGLGRGVSLLRRQLDQLNQFFLDKFQEIKATYQIFFCQARV